MGRRDLVHDAAGAGQGARGKREPGNKADFVLQNNFGWRNRAETENKTESSVKVIYIDREEKESYEKHIDDVIKGN